MTIHRARFRIDEESELWWVRDPLESLRQQLGYALARTDPEAAPTLAGFATSVHWHRLAALLQPDECVERLVFGSLRSQKRYAMLVATTTRVICITSPWPSQLGPRLRAGSMFDSVRWVSYSNVVGCDFREGVRARRGKTAGLLQVLSPTGVVRVEQCPNRFLLPMSDYIRSHATGALR